jgi:hypothetical protein
MPHKILIYGSYLDLLTTRAQVLKTAGYTVYISVEFERSAEIVHTINVDLCILCQSLTPERCDQIVKFASQVRPEMKMLSLSAENVAGLPKTIAVLDRFVWPPILIATVGEMVGVTSPTRV